MALRQSDFAKGILPIPHPSMAGQAVTHRYYFAVTAAIAGALNDIIELACIPAGCRVADMVLDADDLDSNGSPAIALDVGIMSGTWGENDGARTCGNEFIAASNVAQAGGSVRPTKKEAFRDAGLATPRSIGVKIQAAAATGQAGTIGLTLTVVPV
jgi:hypothetical protein